MERWAAAVGYEDYFIVSDSGKVLSKRTNKILKTFITAKGREVFATKFGGRLGKNKRLFIHRLVAESFIPNPENKPQVNHIDGNPLNNHASNLEWATASENMKHSFRNGLQKAKSGLENPNFKLSKDAVAELISLSSTCGIRELGRRFGVHHTTVSRVQRKYG